MWESSAKRQVDLGWQSCPVCSCVGGWPPHQTYFDVHPLLLHSASLHVQLQAISPGEYSLLLEAQLLARRAHISRHDCTGGRGHEAVWTLHGYDPEEVCCSHTLDLKTTSFSNAYQAGRNTVPQCTASALPLHLESEELRLKPD